MPPRGAGRRGGRILDLAQRLAEKAGKPPSETTSLETTEMTLVGTRGRIYYPVFEKRDRPILREFIDVPKQITVFFLFQGDAPLDLTLYAPEPQTGAIVPRRDPEAACPPAALLVDRLLGRGRRAQHRPATFHRWWKSTWSTPFRGGCGCR